TSSIVTVDLFNLLKTNYGGFFIKGFKEEDIPEKIRSEALKVCAKHIFDANLLQYNCLSEDVLVTEMKNKGVEESLHKDILAHYRKSLMPNNDIQSKMETDLP